MVWLFLAFLVLPVVEIYLITQVAGEIGWWLTLFLVVFISVAGAWLVRREGLGVIRRIQQRMQNVEMPTNDLADGAMIFFAAALMLTPGFLTDALGLAMLIPPIRALLRPGVIGFFRRRFTVRTGNLGGSPSSSFGPASGFGPGFGGHRGDVFDVDEVGETPDDERET